MALGGVTNDLPETTRFFIDSAVPRSLPIVETEDTEDASLSSPLPITVPSNPVLVELVLFFLGSGGKTFPGSSVASFLCNFAKSPYRLPM